ncbi:MAG: cobalamin B12-binding domain-containing protein [Planctomycetes bacterium]|nr:cobalamin B12-binding domain-containing protein [Planctomycetota bacterium]
MAKILLVVANATRAPYPVFPLGPSLVAAAARARGHEVLLWDFLFEARRGGALAAAVAAHAPDVIGVSLRNIDNVDSIDLESYTAWQRALVQEARGLSAAPIVLGGAGFSLMPERLLDEMQADYGVAGEGEEAFCNLVARLERGERPAERVVLPPSPLPPERIGGAPPDPDLARFYLGEGGMLNLQAKRGCPYRCAYCTYPLLEGRSCRSRAAQDVVDEMEMLRDRCAADYLAFTDSTFNDAEGSYLEIAEELVRRDLHLSWMAFFRPDRFRPEDVRLLQRAGLRSVEWGTDAASDATLQGLNKGFSWEAVEESSRLFAAAGISGAHFIIFGGPGETPDTVRQGLENVARLAGAVVFAFRGIRVLPGTAMQRLAVEQGLMRADQDMLPPVFYHSPEVDGEFLHAALAGSFQGRPDRVYPPGSASVMARAFHRLGYRGPLWDLLLRNARSGR